ncbi:hypothetical protein [uncultured Muribaculum sp.]|uniref:hypothetical protein n=1 Tax=uncultured Muribaculum sp. TaxID=1918613 RepID=UPI0025DAD123|nr:hypothetical protein [uncultured Muribaculum sp.]
MKKLYIPTTTLNFNNILSSESISPGRFYTERGFGYSRWFYVDGNNDPDVILLYDHPATFSRPDNGLEDHPMLVEIVVDGACVQDYAPGVYMSDRTIYLDPWHTRFVFFSDADMNTAISMSAASIETKLLRLYRKGFTVMNPVQAYGSVVARRAVLNRAAIKDDIRLDRMKGMLYGYYIGAALSTDGVSVALVNALKEVRDIFASIVSGGDRKPTACQDARLDILLKIIRDSDYWYNRIKETIASPRFSAEEKADRVLECIYSSGQYFIGADKDVLLKSLLKDRGRNAPLRWIDSKIENAERAMARRRMWPDPADREIVVERLELSGIGCIDNIVDRSLFIEWCNKAFASPEFNGRLSRIREKLADTITLKARDIYGERWPDSLTKDFLNRLRRHVRGEDMDVAWDNGPLSAVAAVIMAGDDWRRLLGFMQSVEMTDYRLAFAIFGALNGFADMPRDFTDILFSYDNHYIADVYREFHRQLFGTLLNDVQSDCGNDPCPQIAGLLD